MSNLMSFYGTPNAPAFWVTVACWAALGVVMLTARRGGERAAKSDARSLFGVLLQGVAIAVAWFGPMRIAPPPYDEALWRAAAAPGAIAVLSFLLFFWAAATMGANWSLVARTRSDHELVQRGPFALMRHPIYVALFGLMVATALSLGHEINLIVAIPIYLAATLSRVAYEERLLREMFGAAYDDYARRVKRFVPAIW